MNETTQLCESVNNGGVIYSLLCDEADGRIFYSLKIETQLFGESQSVLISDITSNSDECKKMMYAMADGFVTPTTAAEVIENYIVEFM